MFTRIEFPPTNLLTISEEYINELMDGWMDELMGGWRKNG